MVSPDGRFIIVFNGEIYNFKELREELTPNDGDWRSDSDTEVILAAYVRWGRDCLKRLNGMFAFAIWDRQSKTLFAARDRMGVKPFYFHHSRKRFAFASRPRALLQLCDGLSAELDEQGLRLYLEAGYVPAPHSIYRDIKKLPPAHYLTVRDGVLAIERYWDFRQIVPERGWETRKEADLLDELDELVSRSVQLRMISDVPIGAFLSGGIDSSLVVGVMAKHSPSAVKTFTIGFDESSYDESSHAAAVARHLGTEHFCERLRVDDLLALMPTFTQEYDEPFFDSSAFPTMAVSRLARSRVTVSLSGDGGDELFGGYHYYQIAEKLSPLFSLPGVIRKSVASMLGMLPAHRLKLLAGAIHCDDIGSAFAFSRSIAKDFGSVLIDDVAGRTIGLAAMFRAAETAFPKTLRAGEQGMRLDAQFTLADDYLQKVDLASMAFSLESRDPLLDHNLVEWAMRLPISWKLQGKSNKYLLRKLAYRYVPQEILDRPKQGFGVPIERWLRGPLKSWALERLEDSALFQRIPIDQAKARALFDLHQTGARNVHPLLWAILILLDFSLTVPRRSLGIALE